MTRNDPSGPVTYTTAAIAANATTTVADFSTAEPTGGIAVDDELLIACADGAVRLLRVQREGKGPLDASDFLRGAKLARGARLQ